jgi:hypothetical protein
MLVGGQPRLDALAIVERLAIAERAILPFLVLRPARAQLDQRPLERRQHQLVRRRMREAHRVGERGLALLERGRRRRRRRVVDELIRCRR